MDDDDDDDVVNDFGIIRKGKERKKILRVSEKMPRQLQHTHDLNRGEHSWG